MSSNASTDQKLYCYCEKTAVASFQDWLKTRYGTLENLSEAWVRRYPSWEVIDPPRGPGSYIDWVDWRRFMIDRSTEEMRFRVRILRSVDTRSILGKPCVQSGCNSSARSSGDQSLAPGRDDGRLGTFKFSPVAGLSDLFWCGSD